MRSAALTTLRPASANGNTDWIRLVGKPYDGKHIEVNERDVSAKLFQTIGAKLLRGRYFRDDEDESKPEVVIINNTLARKYFPGEDPVGKQIGNTRLSPKSIKTIIGVLDDIREGELDSDIWPAEYHPFNQGPSDYFFIIARTSQEPQAVLPALRRTIQHLHSDIGVRNEATMEALIDNSETASLHRSSAMLVGGFGRPVAVGSSGALRRYRIFGQPENARDRSVNGARRRASVGVSVDRRRGGHACSARYCNRRGSGNRRRYAGAQDAVRRPFVGCPELDCRSCSARFGVVTGQPRAREASSISEPDGSTMRRVTA